MHIFWCFARGFGLLGGACLALVALVYLGFLITRAVHRATGWESEDVGVGVGVIFIFLAMGTALSLAICGILK